MWNIVSVSWVSKSLWLYLYLFNILHVISNVCGEEHASGRSRKPHGENRIHRSFLFSSQRCNHILTTMQTFFYSKNIIPIRSNKFKTFLICNQALRVPTEITFQFAFRAELITSSSSCALPQHLSFFCSSHYYCFFLCQTFTNASLLPNLTFLLTSCVCHIQSIHSLDRAVLKRTCRRWSVRAKGRHESNRQSQWGSLVGSDKCHCVASTQSCRKVKRVQTTPACEISQRKD